MRRITAQIGAALSTAGAKEDRLALTDGAESQRSSATASPRLPATDVLAGESLAAQAAERNTASAYQAAMRSQVSATRAVGNGQDGHAGGPTEDITAGSTNAASGGSGTDGGSGSGGSRMVQAAYRVATAGPRDSLGRRDTALAVALTQRDAAVQLADSARPAWRGGARPTAQPHLGPAVATAGVLIICVLRRLLAQPGFSHNLCVCAQVVATLPCATMLQARDRSTRCCPRCLRRQCWREPAFWIA